MRHVDCFWLRLVCCVSIPGLKGRGRGFKTRGKLAPVGRRLVRAAFFPAFARAFPSCWLSPKIASLGAAFPVPSLVGLQKHGGHHAYLEWLVEKTAHRIAQIAPEFGRGQASRHDENSPPCFRKRIRRLALERKTADDGA